MAAPREFVADLALRVEPISGEIAERAAVLLSANEAPARSAGARSAHRDPEHREAEGGAER